MGFFHFFTRRRSFRFSAVSRSRSTACSRGAVSQARDRSFYLGCFFLSHPCSLFEDFSCFFLRYCLICLLSELLPFFFKLSLSFYVRQTSSFLLRFKPRFFFSCKSRFLLSSYLRSFLSRLEICFSFQPRFFLSSYLCLSFSSLSCLFLEFFRLGFLSCRFYGCKSGFFFKPFCFLLRLLRFYFLQYIGFKGFRLIRLYYSFRLKEFLHARIERS